MRRTRSQLRAAQIARLQAEQAAYDKSVKEAMKAAAFARCDAVEQLYELLEVRPERSITREGKNGAYEVATDKDEVKRSARLVEAISGLLSTVESLQQSSHPPAAQNASGPAPVPGQARLVHQFAGLATGPVSGLQAAS